ncbi:MAG: hypothetical protein LC749_07160 [Actinobacteria bacterium]|nr:hypothetical protein [Actinomycetota bacterium]
MSQYGLIAATVAWDSMVTVAQGVTVNTIEVWRIYVPANKAITGACCVVGTAGVGPGAANDSGFCLYADDGSSQIAKTVADYTIFTTAGLRLKAFPSPVAAQATGRFLRLAMLHTCATTAPKFGAGSALGSAIVNSIVPSGTHRRGVFATSTLTFPTSFTVSTFGTLDSPPLFLGLY